MGNENRISPLTALIVGIFGTGAIGIACGTAVVMYGMRIVDGKASSVLSFADRTIGDLPELLANLPPTLADLLNDRRAPEYASQIEVKTDLVVDDRGHVRPALRISNKGDEVVSLLAVRVAALDQRSRPVGEWTEVVATPIAIDDEWRGPLMPGTDRYLVGSYSWGGLRVDDVAALTTAYEVSEVRVWRGNDKS
jgi:hypothetical protein